MTPFRQHRTTTIKALAGAALLAGGVASAHGDDFVLVERPFETRVIDVVALDSATVTWLDERGLSRSVPIERCIALLGTDRYLPERDGQLVILADGQRLTGKPDRSVQPEPDMLPWVHRWFGKIQLPLDTIAAVRFNVGAELPETGESDVVVLTNGDRLEGFIVGLGASIAIEVEGADGAPQVIEVPLDRVDSVALVAPPIEGTGRRVWFNEGTVIDVDAMSVGEDGFMRVTTPWSAEQSEVRLSNLAAIHLDRTAMTPLAALELLSVEGTAPRYLLPPPEVLDGDAPLGLGALELRGPLIVRYAIPEGARRLVAEAIVPETARGWADFDLVLRVDDQEVYRAHFDRTALAARISVPLAGTELSIEMTEGRYGPIQDRVRLVRAMLME